MLQLVSKSSFASLKHQVLVVDTSCCYLPAVTETDGDADGINLAAPKRRKRTWEEASDAEEADPEVLEAARKDAEMEADR